MKIRLLLAVILAFALIGCSKPVPAEKANYVGNWSGLGVTLLITQEGRLVYQKVSGNTSSKLDVPLKEFEGNNFIAGVGPMNTTFVVSAPPHLDGETWKMTVDGVELTRK